MTEQFSGNEIPKIVEAFKNLYNNNNVEAIDTGNNLLKLKIPNLNNMNPKYVAIAYLILVVLNPRDNLEKFTNNKEILLLNSSKPGSLKFPVYFGKTTYEMLKILFKVELSQQDLLVEHFKMLLTYISAIAIYMIGNVEDLEEEQYSLSKEEEEEEYEDEEYEEEEYEDEEDED